MRFVPSEYGLEVGRVSSPLAAFGTFRSPKLQIRKAVKEAGIPYNIISSGCGGSYFINLLLRPYDAKETWKSTAPENLKQMYVRCLAILNYEEDVGMYTVKVATDPRTLNRLVILRPPRNRVSQLELVSLWEKKTGKSFKRNFVTEEQLFKLYETVPNPEKIRISIIHAMFVKGETNCELREDDMEVSQLYPDVKYASVDELLDIFIVNPPKPVVAAYE